MKSPLSVALFCALTYVIIKLVVFNLGKSVDLFVPLILVNILLILLAVIFGLRAFKKQQKTPEYNFAEDLKCTMRSASVYTIIISVFVFIYYSAIDKNFTEQIIERQFADVTPEDYEKIKKRDPDMTRGKNLDDYKKLKRDEMKLFTSPFITMTMTLVGLMMIGFFYSLLVTIAWPKFLSKMLM